ncbi:hypothetical protein [Massilia niabensis]|uniref:Uncharacterized protein n=1 Tax=Massilia niabensis TaxID=544910 RepID=A0ABW0LBI4_9BURK
MKIGSRLMQVTITAAVCYVFLQAAVRIDAPPQCEQQCQWEQQAKRYCPPVDYQVIANALHR